MASWTDAALLAADPDVAAEAFGVFYERHLSTVLAFSRRRVANAEIAADIAAETFAKALASRHRFDDRRSEARSWLCTISARLVIDAARRGRVEDRTRNRLGMQPLDLFDDDLQTIDEVAGSAVGLEQLERAISDLHPDLRQVIERRVVDGEAYAEIAADLRTSESVIRKRVSRGLARMRAELEGVR